MKVRATAAGYLGGKFRDPGEVFGIPDAPKAKDGKTPAAFSPTWMEPVPEETPVSRKPKLTDEEKARMDEERRKEAEKLLAPPPVDYDPNNALKG